MALIKTVVDLPLTAALSQKYDIRSAPNGIATKALNLVKNKRDTLSKRLGFTSLPQTPPANQAYTYTRNNGLGLGSYLDNMVIFGSGTYRYKTYNQPQTINTLSVYSDDKSEEFQKTLLPEVLVDTNTRSFPVDTYALEVDSAVYQDYIITVWNQASTSSDTTGDIYYSITESRTGNTVIPATLLAAGASYTTSMITPRIVMVGTYAIILFSTFTPGFSGANGGIVFYSALNMAAFPTAALFPIPAALVSNVYTSVHPNTTFTDIGYDADVVNGDSNNFIFAYCTGTGSPLKPEVKVCVVNNASGTLSITSTCVVTSTNLTNSVITSGGGIGVYCDTATNTAVVAVSYTLTGTGIGVIDSTIITGYPSLPGTATFTNLCNSGYTVHFPARSIGICNLGLIDKAANSSSPSYAQSWGLFWGTPGTNLSGTGFLNSVAYQAGSGGYITTSTNRAYPYTAFAQIYSSSGTPTLVSNMPRYTFGCLPVSRPFLYGGLPYVLCYTPSLLQGSYYLMAADFYSSSADSNYFPLRIAATVAVRSVEADIPAYAAHAQPQTAVPSLSYKALSIKGPPGNVSTLLHINSLPLLQYNTYGMVALTSVSLQKTIPTLFFAEFGSRKLYANSTYGQSLAIAGGTPGLFDGTSFAEMSFPYYPEIAPVDNRYDITLGTTYGPIFNNASDVVNYIATYEWTDAQGQRCISARSNAITVNGTVVSSVSGFSSFPTTVNINMVIPYLGFGYRVLPSGSTVVSPESVSGKTNNVEAVLYRTTVNGTVYYRVSDPTVLGSPSTLAAGSSSTVFTQNPNNAYIDQTVDTYVPSSAAPFLTVNPLLYGDGSNGTNGSLDTFNPPSTPIMVKHKNRIFFGVGNVVWYTKELTPKEGPGVNETSMIFAVGDDTAITGLASMDDKLIIFKRKSIYFVAGDGPDDSGNDNNFTQADPIPTELGCSDFRSIVTTPEGTYFQSDAGYRLLDRSLVIQYTGTAVEDEINTYPFLTSSVLHPSTNRLYICANTSDIPHASGLGNNILTGEWLTRDYVLDAWTTGQTLNSQSALIGMFSSAVGLAPRIFNGSSNLEPTLFFQSADGIVWRENDPNIGSPLPYEDNGSFISSQLNLTHFKPSESIDGFSRVWAANVMLYQNDPANITITVVNDYGTSSQIATWTPTQIAAPVGSLSYPVQMYLQNQRLKTIELQMSDAAPTDGSTVLTGQGILFHGITLDCGAYPAAARVNPATRK